MPFPIRICALVLGTAVVASSAVASPSGLAWRGDYETGTFDQWSQVEPAWRTGRATIIGLPVRAGNYAARFEVRSGDSVPSGGELSQVYVDAAGTGGREGKEWYYAWSTLIPSGQRWDGHLDFNVLTQWHHEGLCPSPLGLGVFPSNPARLYVQSISSAGDCNDFTRKKWHIPLRLNRWMDFVVHVHWSAIPEKGFVAVWQDGRVVVPRTPTATLYRDGRGVYFKQGFYRFDSPFTNVVYNDESRRSSRLRDLPPFAQPDRLSTSTGAIRERIERSGRSWDGYLRSDPTRAKALGIRGVVWNGIRIYTKPQMEHILETRGTTFAGWMSRWKLAAAALDWRASDTPYVALVRRPRLSGRSLRLSVRSALAMIVAIEVRTSGGRLIGAAQSRMPANGLLDEQIALDSVQRGGAPLRLSVRAIAGGKTWTLERRFEASVQ